jgi:hypothetical protein
VLCKRRYRCRYTAVGVFVLGRTLQEAWGSQAGQKQREFNAYLKVCSYAMAHLLTMSSALGISQHT